ncbi:MAG: hypothetical protein GY832_27240 [Chloroflexi bacterium]|nr:hypothetical protein [Chloroflexota bacterium]
MLLSKLQYYTTGDVSDVAVEGDYAYVAAGEQGLRVVDVSNPAIPTEVGFYNTPGDAHAVTVADGYVYVADWAGGLLILQFFPPGSRPGAISPLEGEWRRFTSANGLCTDWPRLIGKGYIGTGTTAICGSSQAANETFWPTMSVPIGTRVTGAAKFPDGRLHVTTDAGVCWHDGIDWNCQTPVDGFRYENIQGMTHIDASPVYMLADAIAYDGRTYSIPESIDVQDARPTWIAVSCEYCPSPEIWVGTNRYGIVVIRPDTGAIVHHTTDNGLPGNEIRDINTVGAIGPHCKRYMWVATNGGVGYWDGWRWKAYTTADGLPSDDVRGVSAQCGRVKEMWVATAGGAAYFDGHSWLAFTHENGLPSGDLNGVMVQGDKVWFSTRGSGLLIFAAQVPPR